MGDRDLTRGIPPQVAVTDIRAQIKHIRRKQQTLIDYYIYPNRTPSQLLEYEPRIAKLDNRLANLEKIDYKELAFLFENSDSIAAAWILDIVGDLLNATYGIQQLFCEHYDRSLEIRKPFGTIYDLLEFREQQLKETDRSQQNDPFNKKPYDRRENQVGQICKGAVRMINGRDKGNVSPVADKDLLSDNIRRLQEYNGAYLWWKCADCDFKLRFHVSHSFSSSINSTEEIRTHDKVKAEYKSTFLVKSHLYQPRHRDRSPRDRRNSRESPPLSSDKYACVICLAQGSKKNFRNGRLLATHIADSHRGSKKPHGMITEKLRIALNGTTPKRVHRWDLNLT